MPKDKPRLVIAHVKPEEPKEQEKHAWNVTETGTLIVSFSDSVRACVRSDGIAHQGSLDESVISEPITDPTEPTPTPGAVGVAPTPPSPVPVGQQNQFNFQDLKIGHVIGEGSQAKVRKVKHRPTGKIYALKNITLGKQDQAAQTLTLQQEIHQVMSRKRHPNIVTAFEAFFVDGSVRILMEFMDLGTLKDVVKEAGPLPAAVLSCIARQVVSGAGFLHDEKLMHRDIKPSNLLVNSSGEVKISDFGVSRMLNSMMPYANTVVGSTAYMSPERVRGQQYDASSDLWSVGLTIAESALGRFPFYTCEEPDANPFEKKVNMFDLATMIAEKSPRVEFDKLVELIRKYYPQDAAKLNITEELKDFVWQCMQLEPERRSTCAQLLQHPFIVSGNGRPAPMTNKELSRWFKEKGLSKRDKGERSERPEREGREGREGHHKEGREREGREHRSHRSERSERSHRSERSAAAAAASASPP